MYTLALLLLLPFFGTSSTSSLRPVRWALVGGSASRQVAPGATIPLTVQAEIAPGWHIYSLSQKPGGPIPLTLKLAAAADVEVHGSIKAPRPERIFDKNFGIETELYSGKPRFTLNVGVPRNSPKGIRKFQLAARYQVCSDKLCLPARTEKMEVALAIKGR
jgi:DsbC/DsbD-like thiol-disulfide interchange protein